MRRRFVEAIRRRHDGLLATLRLVDDHVGELGLSFPQELMGLLGRFFGGLFGLV